MSFFALLLALVFEQVRPLASHNWVHGWGRAWVLWCVRNTDTGQTQQARWLWVVAVIVPAVVAWLIHLLLWWTLGWWAALAWSVLVIYATVGFRQFSHHFTQIRDALHDGDEIRARELLALWLQRDTALLGRSEVVRQVMEYSVLQAHRYVFGVFAVYTVLAALGMGPAGAVFYRMAVYMRLISGGDGVAIETLSEPARLQALRYWFYLDWLPVRLTALGFAAAGNFEDTVASWRHHESLFPRDNEGVLIAATAGALHVCLGEKDRTAHPAGLEPKPSHLQSVVGLVWRTLVLWMLLVALLTVAYWL